MTRRPKPRVQQTTIIVSIAVVFGEIMFKLFVVQGLISGPGIMIVERMLVPLKKNHLCFLFRKLYCDFEERGLFSASLCEFITDVVVG